MTFDEDVLYEIVREAVLEVGLQVEYWEAEEVADKVIRRVDEVKFLRARLTPTQRTLGTHGNSPND